MVLEGYGIKLKRLRYEDIEMLRMWRNSDSVKQFMSFREYISIDMQKRWFASLKEDRDFYFIIYKDDYPVGLTEIKSVTEDKSSGDLGIFIAESESLQIPMLTYRAIFTVIDFAFEQLQLTELTASILPDNQRAIRFNESFGFKPSLDQSSKELLYYTLSKDDYQKKSTSIKKILNR